MILTDAGPLVAVLDRADRDHRRCVRALAGLVGPMWTTWPTFTEAMHVIGSRAGWRAQQKLWRFVLRQELHIVEIEERAMLRSYELMRKYSDLPMDLADATLVAFAEAHRITQVFTLDRDFRVYRLHGRRAFEIVP